MARRDVAIEIFAPTEGIHKELGASMITPRSTPSVQNANAYYGVVQKDYGTSLFVTGTVPAAVVALYEANFAASPTFEAFTSTGMYKVGAGTFAVDSIAYTADATSPWKCCMHNEAMFFTQGKNLLQYKATYTATGTNCPSASSGSFMALDVVSFKEHLNIYHTTEGGTGCPKRVRWTKSGLLGYTQTDFGTGTASFLDLQDADGDILAAGPIGLGAVAIYAEDSVHQQEWVGSDPVFRFTKVIRKAGIPTRQCFAIKGDLHYVLTRYGIFEYRGGTDWIDISKPIRADWVSTLNATYMNKSYIQYVQDDDEIRAYVPSISATDIDTVYICKLSDDYAWYKSNRNYTACGVFARPASLKIGELIGNIGAQNWRFGDMRLALGAKIDLLGDKSGRVVKIDRTVYSVSESGTSSAQTFLFNTKDLSSIGDIDPLRRSRYDVSQYMDNNSRWLTAVVEAKGNGTLQVLYSIDGGDSFNTIGTTTVSSTWVMHRFDFDCAAPRCMLQLKNIGTNEVVHIRYVKLEFIPGSEN